MENSSKFVSLFSVFLLLGGCAMTQQPVENNTYVEATPIMEPEPQPTVVEVSKPLPLPGQLKKLPEDPPEATAKDDAPWEVIDKANESASQNPNEYGFYNAMMQYDYAPGALYQVYMAPLKFTDIQMQPGEKILGNPACGDTVRWEYGRGVSKIKGVEREHLYMKPTRPGLHTNLSINTDKRVYHLELHSYKGTYMAAVNWRYPQDEIARIYAESAQRAADNSQITSTLVSLDNVNNNYHIIVESGGTPKWKPQMVFDDGRKTFIKFPREMLTREAPVLFVLSDENETQLVNYRVKNDYYIIDRLFNRAELRLGQKNQTIVRISKQES